MSELIEGMARAVNDYIQSLEGCEPLSNAEWEAAKRDANDEDFELLMQSQKAALTFLADPNNITPEMVEAGLGALWPTEVAPYLIEDEVIAAIYRAMSQATAPPS